VLYTLTFINAANCSGVGLAISDKKNYSAEDGIDGTIGLFRRNSGFGPNCSAEEKNAWNSVLWDKNRSKLSEFRSEPFCGREKHLEFCSEHHSAEEKTTRNSVPWNKNRRKLSKFRSEAGSDETCCLFCLLEQDFL
jgi:hypothetical protein